MRPVDADYIRGTLEAEFGREDDDLDDRQWAYGYAAGVDFSIRKLAEVPTLTPPNEWVNRVRELDELYTKLQIVTGFTAERLLEIFAAGYTLEKPDYSRSFDEMANLAETTPPNEPLTIEQLREMDGEPVWLDVADGVWALVDTDDDCVWLDRGGSIDISRLAGKAYRRPPEGEEEA